MFFKIACSYVVVLSLALYVGSNLHERHYQKDGQYYRGMHIFLPGIATVDHSEHTVELKNWVGSTLDGLEVSVSGERNPEIEASAALKATGLYGEDYKLEQKAGGHWVLHKAETREQYFSLSVPYQVWFGSPAKDM